MLTQTHPNDLPVTNLNDLPNEIISSILAHLSIQDRFTIRQLNRKWRQLSLTGIDELLVKQFKYDYDWEYPNTTIPSPKYEIYFKKDLNRCNLFDLLIKECGKSLKTLVIYVCTHGVYSDDDTQKWIQEWTRIISIIPDHCPNISSFSFKCGFKKWELSFPLFQHNGHQLEVAALNPFGSKEWELSFPLFQHYGHQLKVAALNPCGDPSDYGFCDLAINHFNADHLRCLLLDKINQKYFESIANQFCNLTQIELIRGSIDKEDEINFDSIRKLVQLEQFICHDFLSDFSSLTLFRSLSAKSMHKLEVILSNKVSSLDVFNLTQLRSLTIDCWTSKSLLVNVQKLKELQELDLHIYTRQPYKQWVKVDLLSVSKLKKLKRLRLKYKFIYDFTADCTFSSLEPMPSITCLNLYFNFIGNVDYDCHDINNINYLYTGCFFDILNLPRIFPNLIDFTMYLDDKLGDILSKNDLIECVDNLTKLKRLTLTWRLGSFDWSIQEQLSKLCDRKEILLDLIETEDDPI